MQGCNRHSHNFLCAVGDSSHPLYLQLQHVRVDKINLRHSRMHTCQPVPMPNLHLTIQPRAHKTADTSLTLQAWQSNQTEINTVHFTCQILCLAVSGERPHYISPEHPTTYHQNSSFAIHVYILQHICRIQLNSTRSSSRPTAVCNR